MKLNVPSTSKILKIEIYLLCGPAAGLLQQNPAQQPHLHHQCCCGMFPDMPAAAKPVVVIICGPAHLAAQASLETPPCYERYHLPHRGHCADGESCKQETQLYCICTEGIKG